MRRLALFALVLAGCLDYRALYDGARDLGAADLSANDGDVAHLDLAGLDLAGLDLAGLDATLPVADLATPPDLTPAPPDMVVLGAYCGNNAPNCTSVPSPAFCDDFHEGIDTAKWPTVHYTGGTYGPSVTTVCRGSDSMELGTNGGTAYTTMRSATFTSLQTSYTRAYLYFMSAPVSTNFLQIDDGSGNNIGLYTDVNGHWALRYGATPFAPTTSGPSAGTWTCVEVKLVGGTNPSATLWINDLLIVPPVALSANAIGAAAALTLGLQPVSTTQAAQTLYVGEVSVTPAYLPCHG